MNIHPINISLFKNDLKLQRKNIRYQYNLKSDTISFSGKNSTINQDYSQNIKDGMAIGKKVLKLSTINALTNAALEDTLNSQSPVKINIKDISELPNFATLEIRKTIAHMLPIYNTENLQLAEANIYLNQIPQTSKELSTYAADVAHEYTHVLQRAQDKNYYGILDYTKDIGEITTIARVSQTILTNSIDECSQNLIKSAKDYTKVLESILCNKFDINKQLGKNNLNKKIDIASRQLAINLQKNPDDMKKAIKGWIAQETKNEIEAYNVTINVLENSKCDLNTKASRILSRELYSYIHDSIDSNEVNSY